MLFTIALDDRSPKPAPQDGLEALIEEARARQLRRRLFGAASVAIVAAIGLAGYALTIGGSTDLPGGAAKPEAEAPPLCRSSQLSASSYWNGAAGTV